MSQNVVQNHYILLVYNSVFFIVDNIVLLVCANYQGVGTRCPKWWTCTFAKVCLFCLAISGLLLASVGLFYNDLQLIISKITTLSL